MTPREYLELIVKPNVADAVQKPEDPRLTFNAVATCDALAAHLFYWLKRHAPHEIDLSDDDTGFRKRIASNRANLDLLFDVAKALKHVELERGAPKIHTMTEVQTRPFGFGEGAYGIGPYGGGMQTSILVDGAKVQIALLLHSVVGYFEEEFDRLDV